MITIKMKAVKAILMGGETAWKGIWNRTENKKE